MSCCVQRPGRVIQKELKTGFWHYQPSLRPSSSLLPKNLIPWWSIHPSVTYLHSKTEKIPNNFRLKDTEVVGIGLNGTVRDRQMIVKNKKEKMRWEEEDDEENEIFFFSSSVVVFSLSLRWERVGIYIEWPRILNDLFYECLRTISFCVLGKNIISFKTRLTR